MLETPQGQPPMPMCCVTLDTKPCVSFPWTMQGLSCLQRQLRSARWHADRVTSIARLSTAVPLPDEWLKLAAKEIKVDKDAVAKKLSWHTPDVPRPPFCRHARSDRAHWAATCLALVTERGSQAVVHGQGSGGPSSRVPRGASRLALPWSPIGRRTRDISQRLICRDVSVPARPACDDVHTPTMDRATGAWQIASNFFTACVRFTLLCAVRWLQHSRRFEQVLPRKS